MASMKKLAVWLALLGIVVVVSIYIWPTRYRYDHTNIKGIGLQPVRIDRFNGHTEILYPEGWKDPLDYMSTHVKEEAKVTEEMPYSAQADIDGRAGIEGEVPNALYVASIYNGSDWKITEITVDLNYKTFTRKYRLVGSIDSLSSAKLSTSLDTDIQLKWEKNGHDNPGWSIVSAKGYPPPGYKDSQTYEEWNREYKEWCREADIDKAISDIKHRSRINRLKKAASIAGIAVGGIVVLGGIAVCIRKRRKKKSISEST